MYSSVFVKYVLCISEIGKAGDVFFSNVSRSLPETSMLAWQEGLQVMRRCAPPSPRSGPILKLEYSATKEDVPLSNDTFWERSRQ